jgi:uncharacterized protein YjbI with pentapeptide repeats
MTPSTLGTGEQDQTRRIRNVILMATKKTGRALWGVAVTLAAAMLGGTGLLGVRVKPYLVAKYGGLKAELRGAALTGAPLAGANLEDADLRGADLRRAVLSRAFVMAADLTGANLMNARLARAYLGSACLRGVNLRGADLTGAGLGGADLTGAALSDATLIDARYDTDTRWSVGYDPRKHGAIPGR